MTMRLAVPAVLVASSIFLAIPDAHAQGSGTAITFLEDGSGGVQSVAESYTAPAQAPDDSGWVPTTFDGAVVPVPVAIAAHNCGVIYMASGPGVSLSGPVGEARASDCATIAPPAIDVRTADPNDFGPRDLAAIAFDRARRLAVVPGLDFVPDGKGVTGLRSYFWLAEEPATVTATAEIPGLTVTAEATPVQYGWNFGDGHSMTTAHSGTPWTRRRPGNIGHSYQRRGSYDLTVDVLYAARWNVNGGPWQPLGYFSTSATENYRVRDVVAVLTRSRR